LWHQLGFLLVASAIGVAVTVSPWFLILVAVGMALILWAEWVRRGLRKIDIGLMECEALAWNGKNGLQYAALDAKLAAIEKNIARIAKYSLKPHILQHYHAALAAPGDTTQESRAHFGPGGNGDANFWTHYQKIKALRAAIAAMLHDGH